MPEAKYFTSTILIITVAVLILTTALANRQAVGNQQMNAGEENPILADFLSLIFRPQSLWTQL
jgi:hypothetical protein